MPTNPDRIWTAALIVIGDEILSGRTHDKNIAQVASFFYSFYQWHNLIAVSGVG